jgi:hypothetical protein
MHFGTKGVLSVAFIAAAALSNASINYNNIVATVTYDGGSAENLTVVQDGNSISFVPPPPMIVGGGTGHNTAVINISYDVQADKAINGIDLIFTGFTFGNGSVDFTETVKDGFGSVIASTGDTHTGDGSFVGEYFIGFASQNQYSVEKTFTLDTGQFQELGLSQNFGAASVGLIEQNAVPEPATLGAVGVGLFGLLARKRRK